MDDHKVCVEMTISAARIVSMLNIPKAIQNAERALSAGPVLDPTLWIKKHKDLEQDLKVLEAALPLWRLAKQVQESAE